ncbi:MAG: hypothetical protein AAGK28_06795 [Pseudomonadota bacterium]
MAQFTHITTLGTGSTSALPHLQSLRDLDMIEINGDTFLYSASEATGGMNVFNITGVTTHIDSLGYSGAYGTLGLAQITLGTVDGQAALFPSGRYDNRMAVHYLDSDGSFNGTKYLGASPANIGNFDHTLLLQVDGKNFLVAAQHNQSGYRHFEVRDDLSLAFKKHTADTPDNYLQDITAMAQGTVDGKTYFFTADGTGDGISSYWMGRFGNIKERDNLGAADGFAINAPSALDTALVDGNLFVLAGGAGSNTLSALKVNTFGGLFETDTQLDSLDTRFGGINAIETVTVNDRAFVLAGGADDGVSLFELSSDGRLHHLTSIADETDTTLQNVSTISARAVGDDIQVFAAGSETGITEFTIDLGALGASVNGNDLDNTLTGGALDDLLVGRDGDDTLDGGAGNDRLIDGAGVDTMTGGAGADVFVFTPDNRMDTVTDFDIAEDRLDLSAFLFLYDTSRLDFTQKGYGVLIQYGSDRFRIEDDDTTLQVADLTEDHFIF